MRKHSKGEGVKELNRGKGQSEGVERQALRREVGVLLGRLRATQEESRSKEQATEVEVEYYVGIDLGDKVSRYCFLDGGKETVVEGKLATTAEAFQSYFSRIGRSRIALEVGTQSPWISALLEGLGHEVHVANPRKMESIHKNKRKNDRIDAWILARLARADVQLLHPIRHRGAEARQDLVMLRARDVLVAVRTKLINSARGLVKSVGGRLPRCSASSFHKTEVRWIPQGIRAALVPMLEQIELLTKKVGEYDKRVSVLARKKYPETDLLQQVKGVGDLTSVAYVLTLENPGLFHKSRDVGPYLGLVPKQDDSGDSSPQLRITKTGDRMLRRLLVGSAQYILGPFGQDSDLRRYGLRLATRGGKNAKKRAVVAVARKLAVLLHCLWRNGEVYEPLRQVTLPREAVLATANA